MTIYEISYKVLRIMLSAFDNRITRDIKTITKTNNIKSIVDVGGRKSPYTIGFSGKVTIIDKPPKNEIQKTLNLGIDYEKKIEINKNRSNIKNIILHDITEKNINVSEKFDLALFIEVIEHIEEDEKALSNIHNLLSNEGILYLTTPNGDYIPSDNNPDHVKHYTRDELKLLLSKYFKNVKIEYAIRTGKFRLRSLNAYKIKHPLKLVITIINGFINKIQSIGVKNQYLRTAHLIAICSRKK
jgi:SAM-dependent methyltransferase